MERKISRLLRVIASALIIALVALFTLSQISLAAAPTAQLLSGALSFKEYTSAVQDCLVSDTAGKYAFIDLNGLYCRLTGRNICNYVMRLSNGMLMDYNPAREDMTPAADGTVELAALVEAQGAQFIYIQAPSKMDLAGALLIPGEECHSNENADELLGLLTAAGVDVLDLRQELAATPELIEENFFRTDHHWNFTGAFSAFQRIAAELDARFPESGIDLACADIDNWERHELKDWMLGAHGKRTGVYFGGTDDICYYTPLFHTHMSCDIPQSASGAQYYEGDFAAANLRAEYLGERPNYFESSPYNLYIGGEYPIVRHRSDTAASTLRVLMIKDSFTLPVQAYMSTMFKSLDVLDPRHLEDCSVAEYILETEPDVVLLMLSPGSASGYEAYSDYGVKALAGS